MEGARKRDPFSGEAVPRYPVSGMTSQRDPFADFARMRREMDELLGDFWDQAGYRQRRPIAAFVPRVDVYYCGEDAPEKAIVKVELPGIELDAVNLEVTGRTLVISGERPVRETEGRTYQQVELPPAPSGASSSSPSMSTRSGRRPPTRTESSGGAADALAARRLARSRSTGPPSSGPARREGH